MPTVEKITDSCTSLGEGPHWDVSSQSLYFVDISGKQILKYTPSTNKLTKATIEKSPSFIIPIENKKNQFLVSLRNDLAVVSWDGESEDVKILENICGVETSEETPYVFNDAKCDSSGRLWVGAHSLAADFAKTQPLGVLYSIDSTKQLKIHAHKIRCANGMAFNDKTKKMFFIDSLAGSVDQFDFDIITLSLALFVRIQIDVTFFNTQF
ncbi:hypothetical protein Zmor_013411 [Zophobas morio]|uniref:SMP-30/Gluconolactonase/LRE-like region domain-containing protein n=1 Tax=Zophobas morio TaxID=2755281 RepID=A0AA38IHK0_9CUCU|nr:hypothetical protein Zmor_013411 [Zophobas morio]